METHQTAGYHGADGTAHSAWSGLLRSAIALIVAYLLTSAA